MITSIHDTYYDQQNQKLMYTVNNFHLNGNQYHIQICIKCYNLKKTLKEKTILR